MIEGKDQFEVIEAMGVRTVDEILAKTVELEQGNSTDKISINFNYVIYRWVKV
jgi:hypothetical protein